TVKVRDATARLSDAVTRMVAWSPTPPVTLLSVMMGAERSRPPSVTCNSTKPSAHWASGRSAVVPLSHTVYANSVAPKSPGAGTKTMSEPDMDTEPLVFPVVVTATTVRSCADSLAGPALAASTIRLAGMVTAVPTMVEAVTSPAAGASLTSVTSIATVPSANSGIPGN